MKSRLVQFVSLFIMILLIGGILYGGTLTDPYSEFSPKYAVASESTAQETIDKSEIEGSEIDTDEATPFTDLSPEAQRAFKEAREQPLSDSGWQRLGEVPICDEVLITCDGYKDRPRFPYIAGDSYASYSAVEFDGDVYIVRTRSGDTYDPQFGEKVMKMLILGSYAAFLGYITLSQRYREIISTRVFGYPALTRLTISDRRHGWFAVYGLFLLSISLSYPYIVMKLGTSYHVWHLYLIVILSCIIVLGGILDEIYDSE